MQHLCGENCKTLIKEIKEKRIPKQVEKQSMFMPKKDDILTYKFFLFFLWSSVSCALDVNKLILIHNLKAKISIKSNTVLKKNLKG